MNKKLAIIFGTRPEIIKLSPIIKLCVKEKIPFFCVHSGQHYSYDMEEIFLKELNLPKPKYNLHIKSKASFRQGDHTGRMLIKLEEILLKELPYAVVVQGDTNTVLAGALTAEKISTTGKYTGLHIKVAHVEAGLRSYDRNMPEEINRFLADHLSDFLFVPTNKQKRTLIKEGVPESYIHITGNTIVDAVYDIIELAKKKSRILNILKINTNDYILLTTHRQENVDEVNTLKQLLKGIDLVSKKTKLPVIFPIHPRTEKMLNRFKLKLPKTIQPIKPLGFLDFTQLEANARLILTDSGGIQEEACILKIPCVTLRKNTERPETIEVGASLLAGTDPKRILKCSIQMLNKRRNWKNPFGNGKASKIILKEILK